MKISVGKQTPVMALVALVVIVTAAYVRFAVAPFDNEIRGARVLPLLGEYLSSVQNALPGWSLAVSAVLTVAAGIVIGQMGGRFSLYPSQTFLSMPIFGIIACGIFIPADTLAASVTTLLAAMALRFLCRSYLRERDLSAMLYAGLCIGMMLLLSPAGVVYVIAALSAIFILSFSARELFVLLIAMLLPAGACCYAVWAFGGEFFAPVIRLREALFAESGVETFGDEAVTALVLCGLIGFAFFFSMLLFLANRFMVSVKSRGILIYNVVLALLSLTLPVLPSSTPADFSVAAVPMSVIMPVLFIREEKRLSAVLYLSLWAVFVLHLLYY